MARTDVSSRKARLLTIVVLVATFAAGTASGAGLCHWMAPRPPLPPPPMSAPLPLHELGLSDEQREKTFRIFEQHRPELEAVLRDTFPKVRAINEQIEKEVREVLTPEQRKLLDELKARRPHPPLGPRPPWSAPGASGFRGPPPPHPMGMPPAPPPSSSP